MQKLITLSDTQYEHALSLMQTTRTESFSEFVRLLINHYEKTTKV